MSESSSRSEAKIALRRELLARRRAWSPEALAEVTRALTEALLADPLWRDAGALAAFVGVRKEVDTAPLISRSLAAGKQVWLPRIVAPGQLRFWPCTGFDTLERGQMGLREPPALGAGLSALGPAHGVDLILVPGLGFDRRGARIGFGAGYYDRALARALALPGPPAPRVGVCPAAFVDCSSQGIPTEAHDVHMTHLLTEQGLEPCVAQNEQS